MFLEQNNITTNLHSLLGSHLLLRFVNTVFASGLILHFVMAQFSCSGVLAFLALIYFELFLDLGPPKSAYSRGFPPFFRKEVRSRELRFFSALFVAISGFFLLKSIVLLNSVLFGDLSINTPGYRVSETINNIVTFQFKGQSFLLDDWLLQFGMFIFAGLLTVFNRRQTIRYDNVSVEIFETFCNRKGILGIFVLLLGVLLTRQLTRVTLSVFETAETLFVVFFLTKTFGKDREPGLPHLLRWTNFFRRLCVVKLLVFVVYALLLQNTPWIPMWKGDPLFADILSKLLIDDSKFAMSIFWTVLVYFFYLYISFSIRLIVRFGNRVGPPFLPALNPNSTLFLSYFTKNLVLISRSSQVAAAFHSLGRPQAAFLRDLCQNKDFRAQMEHAVHSKNSFEPPTVAWRIRHQILSLLRILSFHKKSILSFAVDSLFVGYLAFVVPDIGLLGICIFVYMLLIIRFQSFRILWTGSWAFCVTPCFLAIFLLCVQIWIKKKDRESGAGLLHSDFLAISNLILGTRQLGLKAMGVYVNRIVRILIFNTVFIAAKATLGVTKSPSNPNMSDPRFDDSFLFPSQTSLSPELHAVVTSLTRRTFEALRFCFVFFLAINYVIHANGINFLMTFVATAHLVWPNRLTFAFVCQTNFVILCSRFVIGILKPSFHVSGAFLLVSGLGYVPFGREYGRPDIHRALTDFSFAHNAISVYLLLVFRRLWTSKIPVLPFEGLCSTHPLLSRIQESLASLIKNAQKSFKKSRLFLLYLYTLYLFKDERDHEEGALSFVFVTLLLCLHVFILRQRGSLHNKTFIGCLLAYLVYLVSSFATRYISILNRLSDGQVLQASTLAIFRADYIATVGDLVPIAAQILLGLLALKDLLLKWNRGSQVVSQTQTDPVNPPKNRSFFLLQLTSVFMKDLLLFYIVSKFLAQPNIFKMLYVLFYLRYIFRQFRILGQVLSEFLFFELFAAKISFFKRNLLNMDANRPFSVFDFYTPAFRRLNHLYSHLFFKRTFTRFFQQISLSWTLNFAAILAYFVLIHALRAARVRSSDRFLVLHFFLNWKNAPGFLAEEYQDTLIVLVVSIFEVYFVTLTYAKFTAEEKELLKKLPRLLLFRYQSLSTFASSRDSTADGVGGIEDERMADTLTRLQTLSIVTEFPEPPLSGPPEFIRDLNEFVSGDQKFLLLSYIRSQMCLLQVTYVFLHVLAKAVTIPILLGLLTPQLSFFDLSIFVLIGFYYFGSSHSALQHMNLLLAVFSFLDYTLVYAIDCGLLANAPRIKSFVSLIFVSGGTPVRVLRHLIQYTALLKVYFVLCTLACSLLMVSVDCVDPGLYQRIQTQVIRGKTFLSLSYEDWTAESSYWAYKLKKNGLAVIGDFYAMLLLIHFYSESSLPSVLCFTVVAAYKLIVVFQAQQTINDTIGKENRRHFLWLSVFNVALIAWAKWSMRLQGADLSVASRFLFVLVILTSVLVVDCCSSAELQEEKCAAEGYFKVMNHLVVLNRVFAHNEHKLLGHVKQSTRFEHLDRLVTKQRGLDEGLTNTEKAAPAEAESSKLTHKRYKQFVKEQVGPLALLALSVQKLIRRNMARISCSSLNFMAIIATYIEKNHRFLPSDYEFNLPKILNGDFQAIEALISQVEEQKARILREMRANYVESILVRIEESDFAGHLQRRRMSVRGLVLSPAPSTPASGNTDIGKVAKELYGELTLNMVALKMIETRDNNFCDNFAKFRIAEDRYLLIWRYDKIRFQVREVEFWKTGFSDNLQAVLFILAVRVEELVSLLLVALFCVGHGVIAAVFIFTIVFFIFIEDRLTNLQLWKYLYLFFMLGFLTLIAVNCYDNHWTVYMPSGTRSPVFTEASVGRRFLAFVFGSVQLQRTVFIFVVMEFTMALLSRSAGWNRSINEIESPSNTYFRLAIQKEGFSSLLNDRIQLSVSTLNGLEWHLKQKQRRRLNERDYTVFVINLIKRKTKIYRNIKDRFATKLAHVRRLLPVFRLDNLFLKPANFRFYFWRNFAFPMRKSNVDVHKWLVVLLVALIVFYFTCSFRLVNSPHSLSYLFEFNEVDLTLGLTVTLLFLQLLLEQYVFFRSSIYWIESTRSAKDVVLRHLDRLNIPANVPPRPRVPRLRSLFRTTIFCARMRTPSLETPRDDYRHNPMLLRFYATLFFFASHTLLVFVWIPIASNAGHSEKPLSRLFCASPLDSPHPCNGISTNGYLQTYYFLVNLFCLLSAYQIKRGFSAIHHFKVPELSGPLSRLSFFALDSLPFFKETRTAVNYLASESSLDLFKWFKVEDMQATVSAAKAEAGIKKTPGNKLGGFWKWSAAVAAFGLFFLLLISPLYFFSDILLNNMIEEITNARLKAYVEVGTSRFNVFYTTGFTVSRLAADGPLFRQSRNYESLKRIGNEQLRRVSFDRPSQTHLDVNRDELKKIIAENWDSERIRLGFELQVSTEQQKKYRVHYPFAFEPHTVALFLKVLTSDTCSEYNGLQVTFGAASRFIDLRGMPPFTSNENSGPVLPAFTQMFTLQARCHPESNKAWFELSNETARGLSFVVLSENIKNSVQLLRRFSSSKISITSVYLVIFSYFGLSLIRKWCFDNSHRIWLGQMPNSDLLQHALFKIGYCRLQGRLFDEERSFNKLIDLFRSPESIKKLTGALHKASVS